MSSAYDPLSRLLELTHQLGREERKLALFGEGNTAARLSDEHYSQKALGL